MWAWWFSFASDYYCLDDIVGQDFLCDGVGLALGNIAEEDILSCGSNIAGFDAHIGHCRHYGLGYRVGDAAFQMHLD